MFKHLKIKSKLILLFIVIKVLPLLLISFIAIEGARSLNHYFEKSTKESFIKSKEIIENTADTAIKDSIQALDKKSQNAIERLSFELAEEIANFLYERDRDLLFLSKLGTRLDENILKSFMESKSAKIVLHPEYTYNEEKKEWLPTESKTDNLQNIEAELQENKKEFNHLYIPSIQYKTVPLYKEIQFIDLEGNEKYKISSINTKKINIQNQEQTYCKAENYFKELSSLKKGEIYVSEVIGAYVGSPIIGTFTKEKALKANIDFTPEVYGYAGKENPVGKRFEGIIRFATPVFENNQKIGYITFALDHRHIMEFSDTLNPLDLNPKQEIADASSGNYAFIWDFEGKSISHPRDYFIMGYDPKTGEQVPGWISHDVAEKFTRSSSTNLNSFLQTYPQFEEQSLSKKPNVEQIKKGELGLDCRYLNFAPQCKGWMNLTQDGGYGSFVIFWSNVWKLTTAASIPYYSGQYKNSPRGFGFVTIGANVHEFHAAANRTKENIDQILKNQVNSMQEEISSNKENITNYILDIINDLSFITLIMVIIVIAIAIIMSNMITQKIEKLLQGTKEYSKHNFNYKINTNSYDEIGELEHSFNDMSHEIQQLVLEHQKYASLLDIKVHEANQASKAKSEFLASMSHEIRTPLNAILGFVEILLENEKDSERINYLNIINDSSKTLLATINDILDFSKIESDKIELEYKKINPYDSIRDVLNLFEANAKKKVIEIDTVISPQLPKCIKIDELRVKQVVHNLFSNAIKFTPKNGKIRFRIDFNPDKYEMLISVEDTGIGIDDIKKETIFESFSQEDNSTTREYGGSGLGLAISYRLVELMGGKLQLKSTKGVGSTFYFNIPIPHCDDSCNVPNLPKPPKLSLFSFSENKTAPSLQKSQKAKAKILVVEDNKSNQAFMKVLLEKLDLEFTIAENGLDAIEQFKEDSFSLILMDENMPKMNGIEATKIILDIERQHQLPHTPIVALTANAVKGDRERFLSAGMDEYLTKPMNIEKLKNILAKFI
jgi:signal transduction histidine kinase/CheY-like chemotaxis protein